MQEETDTAVSGHVCAYSRVDSPHSTNLGGNEMKKDEILSKSRKERNDFFSFAKTKNKSNIIVGALFCLAFISMLILYLMNL
jgi:hypothetical protein